MLNKTLCLTKFLLIVLLLSCNPKKDTMIEVYETSASGHTYYVSISSQAIQTITLNN
jgi:hypothetical protein